MAIETHVMKFPVHSFCADVNGRGGFNSAVTGSQQSLGDFFTQCTSALSETALTLHGRSYLVHKRFYLAVTLIVNC